MEVRTCGQSRLSKVAIALRVHSRRRHRTRHHPEVTIVWSQSVIGRWLDRSPVVVLDVGGGQIASAR
jgi:hypothetical protein